MPVSWHRELADFVSSSYAFFAMFLHSPRAELFVSAVLALCSYLDYGTPHHSTAKAVSSSMYLSLKVQYAAMQHTMKGQVMMMMMMTLGTKGILEQLYHCFDRPR